MCRGHSSLSCKYLMVKSCKFLSTHPHCTAAALRWACDNILDFATTRHCGTILDLQQNFGLVDKTLALRRSFGLCDNILDFVTTRQHDIATKLWTLRQNFELCAKCLTLRPNCGFATKLCTFRHNFGLFDKSLALRQNFRLCDKMLGFVQNF